MLKDLISKYIEEINAARIEEFEDRAAEVEKFRIRFLGRKGVMNELFEQFKALPNEQKKEMTFRGTIDLSKQKTVMT